MSQGTVTGPLKHFDTAKKYHCEMELFKFYFVYINSTLEFFFSFEITI